MSIAAVSRSLYNNAQFWPAKPTAHTSPYVLGATRGAWHTQISTIRQQYGTFNQMCCLNPLVCQTADKSCAEDLAITDHIISGQDSRPGVTVSGQHVSRARERYVQYTVGAASLNLPLGFLEPIISVIFTVSDSSV